MKKLIILFCSLILAITLTACGENASGSDLGNGVSSGSNMGSSVESAIDNAASGVTELVAKISAEDAKRTALEHAKLKEEDVKDLDIDLDRDGGVLKYEIDFRHGDIEYDYDINAETGKIISADKDRED